MKFLKDATVVLATLFALFVMCVAFARAGSNDDLPDLRDYSAKVNSPMPYGSIPASLPVMVRRQSDLPVAAGCAGVATYSVPVYSAGGCSGASYAAGGCSGASYGYSYSAPVYVRSYSSGFFGGGLFGGGICAGGICR